MTIAKHLAKLFELVSENEEVALNEERKGILKNFSLMPDIVIPLDVQKWLNCNINDIAALKKLGWLERYKKGYYVHSIVKMAIQLQYEKVQYEECEVIIKYMSGEDC